MVDPAAVATLRRWKASPLLFVREALSAEPDPWQAEALTLLPVHRRVSIRSGHGVGKSTFDAWVVLWFIATHFPCKIPITGSNFTQLKATLWAEVGMWLRRLLPALAQEYEYTTEMLRLKAAPQEAFAALRTASKDQAQNLAGFHSDNVLVLVDEASAVDDLIFEVLDGALTGPTAYLLMTGNPTQGGGRFYRSHHQDRGLYATMHVGSERSPRVSDAWVEQQRSLYGDTSNVYRVRVLGEFPSGDDDGVIPLELVEAALCREVQPLDVAPIWGLDVARFGDDRSALCKRQGNVILERIRSWQGKDTEEVAGAVIHDYATTPLHLRPSHICVDVIGIGAGVVDKLRHEPRLRACSIIAVNVSESPARKGHFARLRDQLWFDLRAWFEGRDVAIPNDQDLVAELTLPRYGFVGGRQKVEGKDEMKRRGVRSPDLAESVLMTMAAGEARGRAFGGSRGQPVQAGTRFDAFTGRAA